MKHTDPKEDFSQWYNDLIDKADLAEYSGVRGCMIIKPYGYAIWERMERELDAMIKDSGHQNAYFPLFIPKSYLSKEAAHVDGFAKECAVVTHYRLKNNEHNEVVVDPNAQLEEELIVRPTSETIIWDAYRRWIKSYRDLPMKVNQWANVVRWEMRVRLFLRTAEFLWQEGHTAHASREEAVEETEMIIDMYQRFVEDFLAIPVIKGVKSASERFAGAEETYCIEALMQDGKALQMGTSHFLGQNFAKAFDVKYHTPEGAEAYVWATSWGVSTRLMGALIMVHSDAKGLVLPPKLAPVQVVIIPILKKGAADNHEIEQKAQELKKQLQSRGVRVQYDNDDNRRVGWKFNEYEAKGVPIRLSLGAKDLENQTAEVVCRSRGEKRFVPLADIADHIEAQLEQVQAFLFEKAKSHRQTHTYEVKDYAAFKEHIAKGFVICHWDGSPETEERVKQETKATIRCIPIDEMEDGNQGVCIFSGKPSKRRVVFARAY